MPLFHNPVCDSLENNITCSKNALHDFIYDNMAYPEIARENGVEGTVYVMFVVEKDGSITDAKILRDIGSRCGDEALRVVAKMPKWKPAMQSGKVVRCQYNLPVKFMLENGKPVKPPYKPN